jgi:hypothetical protein
LSRKKRNENRKKINRTGLPCLHFPNAGGLCIPFGLKKRGGTGTQIGYLLTSPRPTPASLPAPDSLAAEIADDLETALEQFTKIATRLSRREN